jgi:hypothetical protein
MSIQSTIHSQSRTRRKIGEEHYKSAVITMALGEKK